MFGASKKSAYDVFILTCILYLISITTYQPNCCFTKKARKSRISCIRVCVCFKLWGMGAVRFWVYEYWGKGAVCICVLHSLHTIMTDISIKVWEKTACRRSWLSKLSEFVYSYENCKDGNSWNSTWTWTNSTNMMLELFPGRQSNGGWGEGLAS